MSLLSLPLPTSGPLRLLGFILAALATLPPTAIALRYHLTHAGESEFSPTVSPVFASSDSIEIVNPHGHRYIQDAFTLTLDDSALVSDPDEEILAKFLKGFFGGWSFFPEHTFLRLLRKRFVKLGDVKPSNENVEIWSSTLIPLTTLLPLQTIFFGGFQIISKRIASASEKEEGESHVDLGFGNSSGIFAGCHRISLSRSPKFNSDGSRRKQTITLGLSHISCHPSDENGRPPFPEWFHHVHNLYARFLFADGMKVVRESS